MVEPAWFVRARPAEVLCRAVSYCPGARHRQAVDSIADILLVEQDAYAADHWTRAPDRAWPLRPHLSGPDAMLALPAMGGEWRLEELYGDG